MKKFFLAMLALLAGCSHLSTKTAEAPKPTIHVLVSLSKAKDHQRMMAAAEPMLQKMAAENNWVIDITDTNDGSVINDANLAHYQVFMQLQQAPFDMAPSEQQAVQKFVEAGHGWVGIHAAGLPGKQFLGPNGTYWQWYEDFLGGVIYSPHPRYQKAMVVFEDRTHPVTRHMPATMEFTDEWYEFNQSPRPRVHVLAHVDESTYHPSKPMGDHPMIWSNEKYRRMIYICIGHDAYLCSDPTYQTLIRDAIEWAGN